MRQLLLFIAALTLAAPTYAAEPQVHNIAEEFAKFWDATQNLPRGERVAAFKKP